MATFEEQLEKIAKSQGRQQLALIVMSIFLAASMIVTWKSLAVMREATALQRQQLALQTPEPAPKATPARKSSSREGKRANAELHRSPSVPAGHERVSERESATPSTTGTSIASSRAIPDRQGRQ